MENLKPKFIISILIIAFFAAGAYLISGRLKRMESEIARLNQSGEQKDVRLKILTDQALAGQKELEIIKQELDGIKEGLENAKRALDSVNKELSIANNELQIANKVLDIANKVLEAANKQLESNNKEPSELIFKPELPKK
jgi:chromosome segregation ATPase